jgi:hypothetical protein
MSFIKTNCPWSFVWGPWARFLPLRLRIALWNAIFQNAHGFREVSFADLRAMAVKHDIMRLCSRQRRE